MSGFSQQPGTMPTIGVLMLSPPSASNFQSFLIGLRDLGWIDGQNMRIEFRRPVTFEELRQLAADLVGIRVDVIFAGARPSWSRHAKPQQAGARTADGAQSGRALRGAPGGKRAPHGTHAQG